MIARRSDNAPAAIMNPHFQFLLCFSFIPSIILEIPLNNKAIPNIDITIIEVVNGNAVAMRASIIIAIPKAMPAKRDLVWSIYITDYLIRYQVTNKRIPNIQTKR